MSSGELSDFREFASFLKSLWGVLAGLAGTLFPLSAALYQVVPVPSGLSGLFAAVSSILSLFSILIIFVSRETLFHFMLRRRSDSPLALMAIVAFVLGIGSFVTYLSSVDFLRTNSQAASTIGLLNYSLAFALVTTGFCFAALAEYLTPWVEAQRVAEEQDLRLDTPEGMVVQYLWGQTHQPWAVFAKDASGDNTIFSLRAPYRSTKQRPNRIRATVDPNGNVVEWTYLHTR